MNYVDGATAQQQGLTSVSSNIVTIRSDSTNIASGRGRNSVRLTSKNQYTHGLVVIDLAHMPGSACGVWPAFWMAGPNWPNNGEIDILEGVNLQSTNAMTLHTNDGCQMVNKNCQGGQGCTIQGGGAAPFGDGFNAAGGGVYAMEWTSSAIKIWFFGRGSIPADATGSNPDPTSWGNPTATFEGGAGCTIDNHFQRNNIIFDTTFCGDWAGALWGQEATCSSKAASCQDYVRENPAAFESAYWSINSLKVYSAEGNAVRAAVAPVPSSATAVSVPVADSTPTEPRPTTTKAPSSPPVSDNMALGSLYPGGPIVETPTKRDFAAQVESVLELPNATTTDGQVHAEKGKAMIRHLRRHQLGGFKYHPHK